MAASNHNQERDEMNMSEQKANGDSAQTIKPYARLVSLPIRPEHIFHFPLGLPAFEDFKNYVFTLKPDTRPFMFMNAIEPAGLSFVCVDPFLVHPRYAPRIGAADLEFLRVSSMEDILLMGIVTVRPDVRDTTVNLQGPLAINMKTSIGKQVICDGQTYSVRHRIWDAIETMRTHETLRGRRSAATCR